MCMSPFLPAQEPAPGILPLLAGLGGVEGVGGCPQSLHFWSDPCVSGAVSSLLVSLLPHPSFTLRLGAVGGLLYHLPKTPAPGPGSPGVVSGGGFSIQQLRGPECCSIRLQIPLEPWDLGLEKVGNSFGFFPLSLPVPDFVPWFSRAVGEPFTGGSPSQGALPKAPRRAQGSQI